MKQKRSSGKNYIVMIWLTLTLMLSGCGSEVVFTKGFGKDQVFQVGEDGCNTPEMMVYLLSTRGQYEKAYGDGIWNANLGEETLENEVKESVLEKAAQIKTMYLMALSYELSLEEKEEEACKKSAEEYLGAFEEGVADALGIIEDVVEQMYREYALAEKVYEEILADVTPEISDDEARIITVQHILIKTYEKNGNGQKINYSEERKAQAYEKAKGILQEATSGDRDFAELASRYSDDPTLQYSFSKGEMDASFERAAFQLSAGEVSDVVESESGYHIIKCLETLDRERTESNKLIIMETRKNEVFGKEYDAFVEKLARRVNVDLWEDISFLEVDTKACPNFFEYYVN